MLLRYPMSRGNIPLLYSEEELTTSDYLPISWCEGRRWIPSPNLPCLLTMLLDDTPEWEPASDHTTTPVWVQGNCWLQKAFATQILGRWLLLPSPHPIHPPPPLLPPPSSSVLERKHSIVSYTDYRGYLWMVSLGAKCLWNIFQLFHLGTHLHTSFISN